MKDAVRRLNEEYHFELTDKEVDIVVQQAEEAALLFKPLFEVNVDGVTPLTIVDKRVRQISAAKKDKK
jgi:Asp-tRNA(Asn)/Glu-tRNA(Gln) amidotransferase C subunit